MLDIDGNFTSLYQGFHCFVSHAEMLHCLLTGSVQKGATDQKMANTGRMRFGMTVIMQRPRFVSCMPLELAVRLCGRMGDDP